MAKWGSLESGSRGYEGIKGEGIDESSQGEYYSKKDNLSNSAFESQLYVFELLSKDLDNITASKYRSEVEKIKEELKATGKISTSSLMKMNRITTEMDNIIRSSSKKTVDDDFKSSLEKSIYSADEVIQNYSDRIKESDKMIEEIDKDKETLKDDVNKMFG